MLIAALFSPLIGWSQDCKLKKETDPFTKETKISSGFIRLQGASVTVDADKSEIDILFSMDGTDKCFDNSSTAAIFFEGTKLKMTTRNSGSMNCEGLFHFTVKNTPSTASLLQKLSTQKLNNIVFTGNTKQQTTLRLTPEQQQTFMTFANCVATEAKTLIRQ